MYHTILFDLDGTLTDSKEGILKSIQYALQKMNAPVPGDEILTKFIGPPLQDSFMKYCGFTVEQTQQAIALFRERYVPIGKFENAAAPGMPELCAELKKRGYTVALSSSKPEKMCVPICQRFGYTPSMTVIAGSPESGDWSKADVIRETLRRLNLTDADKPEILMVGDRKFDVEGAAECGIACAGVEFFGYAAPNELEDAGAVMVAKSAEELREFILSH
jgi:phosphoglycolate phosphatase